MMTLYTCATIAGRALAEIYELVELIVLDLDYYDLLRVRSVSPFWNSVINTSPKLQRVLHKIPTPISFNSNPHFHPASAESRNSLVPHGDDSGHPILGLCEQLTESFLGEMRPEYSRKQLAESCERFKRRRFRYRYSCRNIRRPNGWPVGFKDIFCYICDSFHARFKFENLHPVLAGLEDVQICFRGHGPHILFTNNTRFDLRLPRSCFDHIIADFRELAKILMDARDAMNNHRIHNDLLTRPICTRLVSATEAHPVENKAGITLGEAVPFFIKVLCTTIISKQSQLEAAAKVMVSTDFDPSYESAYQMHTWSMQPENEANFPTEADWNSHTADLPNILAMFTDAVKELRLMEVADELCSNSG